MTTNADRKTLYEHETTDSLIAEVRRLRADNIAPQSSRNRLVALTEQLADTLEASEAQVAELKAALAWESKPADLLEAVMHLARCDYESRGHLQCEEARIMLTRYGLLPVAPMEDARPSK